MFKKITPQTAFAKGLTEKEKAAKIIKANERLQEIKDSARKLVASDQFKDFRKQYASGREVLVEIFKTLEPSDHAQMIKVQAHLDILDDILAIEKKAE